MKLKIEIFWYEIDQNNEKKIVENSFQVVKVIEYDFQFYLNLWIYKSYEKKATNSLNKHYKIVFLVKESKFYKP